MLAFLSALSVESNIHGDLVADLVADLDGEIWFEPCTYNHAVVTYAARVVWYGILCRHDE